MTDAGLRLGYPPDSTIALECGGAAERLLIGKILLAYHKA